MGNYQGAFVDPVEWDFFGSLKRHALKKTFQISGIFLGG